MSLDLKLELPALRRALTGCLSCEVVSTVDIMRINGKLEKHSTKQVLHPKVSLFKSYSVNVNQTSYLFTTGYSSNVNGLDALLLYRQKGLVDNDSRDQVCEAQKFLGQ